MVNRKTLSEEIINFKNSDVKSSELFSSIQKKLYEQCLYRVCYLFSKRYLKILNFKSDNDAYIAWWYFGRSSFYLVKINYMKTSLKECFYLCPDEPKNSFLLDDFRHLNFSIASLFADVFPDYVHSNDKYICSWENAYDDNLKAAHEFHLCQKGESVIDLSNFEKYRINAPKLKKARLSDVVIRRRGKWCAFFKNSSMVRDLCFPYPEIFEVEGIIDKMKFTSSATYVAGVSVFVADEYSANNYAHWLVDQLPRLLYFVEDLNLTYVNVLSYDPLPEYVKQSIDLIPGLEFNILDMRKFPDLLVQDLCILNSVMDTSAHPAYYCDSNIISKFLLLAENLPKSQLFLKKNIYVSRQKSRRKIINQLEVEQILNEANFETVYLQDLDFCNQVSLFNNAEAIFSVHGAGLANLLFARKDCRVFEYFPDSFGTTAFLKIGLTKGMYYTTARNSVSNRPNDIGISEDVHVDLQFLNDWLISLKG